MWNTYEDYSQQWPSSQDQYDGRRGEYMSYPSAAGGQLGQWAWDGDPSWRRPASRPGMVGGLRASGGAGGFDYGGLDRMHVSRPHSADPTVSNFLRAETSRTEALQREGQAAKKRIKPLQMQKLGPSKGKGDYPYTQHQNSLDMRRDQKQPQVEAPRLAQNQNLDTQQNAGIVKTAKIKKKVVTSSAATEGNVEVVVTELLDNKLGLNLRGVKVDNFSHPDAPNPGWKKGDVMIAINGQKITNFEQFASLFQKAKASLAEKPIVFRVFRDSLDSTPHSALSPSSRDAAPNTKFVSSIVAANWNISGQEYLLRSGKGYRERVTVNSGIMGADAKFYLPRADGSGWIVDDSTLSPKKPAATMVPLVSVMPYYGEVDMYARTDFCLELLRQKLKK